VTLATLAANRYYSTFHVQNLAKCYIYYSIIFPYGKPNIWQQPVARNSHKSLLSRGNSAACLTGEAPPIRGWDLEGLIRFFVSSHRVLGGIDSTRTPAILSRRPRDVMIWNSFMVRISRVRKYHGVCEFPTPLFEIPTSNDYWVNCFFRLQIACNLQRVAVHTYNFLNNYLQIYQNNFEIFSEFSPGFIFLSKWHLSFERNWIIYISLFARTFRRIKLRIITMFYHIITWQRFQSFHMENVSFWSDAK
jgi:hypothetical protein